MSKPKSFIKKAAGEYFHEHARTYRVLSVNHADVDPALRAATGRKGWIAIKNDVDPGNLHPDDNIMDFVHSPDMHTLLTRMDAITVTRTNIMSGAKFEESILTPFHCSPSSEAFFSN